MTEAAPGEPRRRPAPSPSAAPAPPVAAPAAAGAPDAPTAAPRRRPPAAFDFFPAEEARETGLVPFFTALRAGRLTTTRCARDGELMWPPRLVCPRCHCRDVTWVDLPGRGRLYAFSAVLAGAPLGMEDQVPFVVGLVDLDGAPLRLFGRIVGAPWEALAVGDPVGVEPFDTGDGRVFYRFRAGPPAAP